jgi:hypothetical protein
LLIATRGDVLILHLDQEPKLILIHKLKTFVTRVKLDDLEGELEFFEKAYERKCGRQWPLRR